MCVALQVSSLLVAIRGKLERGDRVFKYNSADDTVAENTVSPNLLQSSLMAH